MEQLRFIIMIIKSLLSQPRETWMRLSDPNEKAHDSEYSFRTYYWPIMGVGALMIFILFGNGIMLRSKMTFDDPFSFEYAMKGMVNFTLSYFAGPTLASLVIGWACGKLAGMKFDKNQLEVFVLYNMSILMLCDMFCALLPTFTFLAVLKLYMLYIMLEGVDNFMKIERARGFFSTLSALAIYFSPDVIHRILAFFEK